MKRLFNLSLAALIVAAFAAQAAQAQPHGGRYNQPQFRIQLGEYTPDGDSVYWDDKEFDFTGGPDDFEDTAGGVSYLHPLGPKLSLMASAFGYEGTESQAYIAFEDEFGGDILHTTELELTAVTVGLHYKLTGPDAAVIPYIGAGGGLYVWRLTEFGDFIDFGTPDLEIFNDFFEQEDEEMGWYFNAGLEVPVADFWSIFAEARWDNAEGDLSGDFRGLGEIDLSGRSYSAGLAWTF